MRYVSMMENLKKEKTDTEIVFYIWYNSVSMICAAFEPENDASVVIDKVLPELSHHWHELQYQLTRRCLLRALHYTPAQKL
jgi:hypothetical protein